MAVAGGSSNDSVLQAVRHDRHSGTQRCGRNKVEQQQYNTITALISNVQHTVRV